jgi:hypothetical protein
MNGKIDPLVLDGCVRPLDEDDRRELRRYWEQVIREEWVPPSRWKPRAVPLAGDGRRERRQAHRAVARIAAAGRLARLRVSREDAAIDIAAAPEAGAGAA